MDSVPRSVTVDLGSRTYQVLIGKGLLRTAGSLIQNLGFTGRAVVITDETVGRLYGKPLFASLAQAGFSCSQEVIPSGENSKSFTVVEQLCEALARTRIDRSAFVVALGGGVVGDLAGFVASIYARGLPYVQIPTTIMAQVDSAVGGKTAVNLTTGKNLVGSFHQPALVLADTATLETLPERVKNEGFAEVIKYGVIRQPNLLDALLQPNLVDLAPLIADCVSIKARIVAKDERENSGERALLNFGHTIGHGIEAVAGYGTMLHGEAISLGMRVAMWLSVQHARFPESDYRKVLSLLEKFKLPVALPSSFSTDAVIEKVFSDKKFVRGEIRFVLTPGLGAAFVSDKITRSDLATAIGLLRESRV
ncbi:MAG TPA: 3-dehydroquinate synthase [Chthoniobacterales bacterium]|nr:3-dehydroquinate synthase [Chthoniobacterales bacterium]